MTDNVREAARKILRSMPPWTSTSEVPPAEEGQSQLEAKTITAAALMVAGGPGIVMGMIVDKLFGGTTFATLVLILAIGAFVAGVAILTMVAKQVGK